MINCVMYASCMHESMFRQACTYLEYAGTTSAPLDQGAMTTGTSMHQRTTEIEGGASIQEATD